MEADPHPGPPGGPCTSLRGAFHLFPPHPLPSSGPVTYIGKYECIQYCFNCERAYVGLKASRGCLIYSTSRTVFLDT